MKLHNRRLLVVLTSALLMVSPSSPAEAAKAGQKCSKAGITTGQGANKLTCVKKGKSLLWKKTPESALGSARMPIPMGTKFKIAGIEYSITAVNASADSLLCAANSFNKGCKLDDNFKSIVDPNSQTTWLTVEMTATNTTNSIIKPGGIDKSFYLVLSNGQLLERELFATFPQNFYDVQAIPGGTGVGQIPFALPKSGSSTSTLLVFRDKSNFLKNADYYFEVKW
jgi:hypothetical protein